MRLVRRAAEDRPVAGRPATAPAAAGRPADARAGAAFFVPVCLGTPACFGVPPCPARLIGPDRGAGVVPARVSPVDQVRPGRHAGTIPAMGQLAAGEAGERRGARIARRVVELLL